MRRYPILLVVLASPLAAIAQDANSFLCTNGELQRRVEIVYEPGMSVPCEVHYFKDTEAPGERQVLWRAQSEEGFCEARTEEFIARLTGWGWSCSGTSGETPMAGEEEAPGEEAMPVEDDTAALEPDPN